MQVGGVQSNFIPPWYQLSGQAARVEDVIPQAAASLPRNFDTLDLSGAQQSSNVAAAGKKAETDITGTKGLEKMQKTECETCANRAYQDGSNDPSVSFKSAQKIDPRTAAATVMNHEMEHVRNEEESAKEDGREVISQTVTLKYGLCPECGKLYVAGGETKTVTKTAPQQEGTEKQPSISEL